MDYSDHSGNGENFHIWDVFGSGLDMGCKGKISYQIFGQSNLIHVPYTEIEEWVNINWGVINFLGLGKTTWGVEQTENIGGRWARPGSQCLEVREVRPSCL